MARTRYRWDGERMVEIDAVAPFVSETPFVQGDAMDAISSMITGEKFDSKSRYVRHVKSHGCEIVGNDLLSRKKQVLQDKITDSKILDAIERAESTLSNPDKMQEVRYRNEQALEQRAKMLGIR